MVDPITSAKGLTQPTVGSDNNTWGGLLNTNFALIDSALGGTVTVSISGSITLTGSQAQNTAYEFSGSLSGNATITFPTFFGFAVIQNATTGGFSLICGMSSGATVTVFNGETAAIWSDGTSFVRLAPAPGTSSVRTSAYTVRQADANTTISFGGNTCYPVSIPAASGFAGNFQVRLYNADAGRAKTIAVNGYSNFFLWPGQNVVIQNIGGSWHLYPLFQRWDNTTDFGDVFPITFYLDPSGNDSNDGLTQSSAFLTATALWNTATRYAGGPVGIQLTPGATYTDVFAELDEDVFGNFGSLVSMTGDPTLANPPIITASSSNTLLTVRDGAWLQFDGIQFGPAANVEVGVSVEQLGLGDFQNCRFAAMPSGFHVQGYDNANINYTNNIQITGGALAHWHLRDGAKINVGGTIDGTNAASAFSFAFLSATSGSRADFSEGPSFVNCGSITGSRYNLSRYSFVVSNSITLPGNSAGTTDATSTWF